MRAFNKEIFKSKRFIYTLVFLIFLLEILIYLSYTFGDMKTHNPVYIGDYKENLDASKIVKVLEEHNISTFNITGYGLFVRFHGLYENHTLYDTDVVVVENSIFVYLNESSYPRCTYDEAVSREKYLKPTVEFMKEIIHEATGEYPVKEEFHVPD